MKKIYVIGSRNSGGKNDPQSIASAARADKVIYWEDLLFEISQAGSKVIDKVSGADLKDASLVVALNWYKNGALSIYRDAAYTVALYLEHHQVKFWNSEMGMQRSTTKLSSMMQLALNGFDVPRTSFSLSNDSLMAAAGTFPLIIKDAAASRGKHNYRIDDKAQLEGYLADQDGPNRYMMQELIPNDSDLRIVCFGGTPKLVIKRSRADDSTHLNNTSRGGQAELVDLGELDPKLITDCQKICRLTGREMAGIDLMVSNEGLSRQVYLEVNAIPQLTSGTFIDQKLEALADSLTDYLERNQL
jgi:glutathione synthase/RimK-type ligase-like ATP-grasp enzyme